MAVKTHGSNFRWWNGSIVASNKHSLALLIINVESTMVNRPSPNFITSTVNSVLQQLLYLISLFILPYNFYFKYCVAPNRFVFNDLQSATNSRLFWGPRLNLSADLRIRINNCNQFFSWMQRNQFDSMLMMIVTNLTIQLR